MSSLVAEQKSSAPVKFEAEPRLSFIVPIYDIKPDVLKRCLMSLDEQDYERLEVVCVLDGPNDDLMKVAAFYVEQQPDKFKLLEIDHGGACAARNAGFNVSSGEIVSFFNSDYIAKPGMARMWVDALKNHPDCGFAYGAYEYATARRMWYGSKPFDKWQLDVANYIDCGFPLWRKYVVEWDPGCKSLQDWDFWLGVIKKHGVKGHYLGREISFIAEPPRPKGLSDDSHNNWADRVHWVKRKHGIAEPEILVCSFGAAAHGVEIAKTLGADFRDDTWSKPNNYKALYLIGFYMRPTDDVNDHPRLISHYKDAGAKIVLHFVGADIYWLRKFPHESLKYLAGSLRLSCDTILCENEQAQKELAEMGIQAQIVPIPPYSDFEVRPLPEQFRVATFLTDKSDFDKYCYEPTLSIIRAMPDVQFAAYGDGGKDVRYPNLVHMGAIPREKWPEFVYSNSALLRIVRHDTRPMASDEFILAGRDVITNVPATFVEYIDTKGKSELNEWDIFQEGLNAYNWPATKKKIIQRIRWLKINGPDKGRRGKAHDEYAAMLDRASYINTIKGLCLD